MSELKAYLTHGRLDNGKTVTYAARLATIQEAASLAPKYLFQMHRDKVKPVSVEEVYPGTERKVRDGEAAYFDDNGNVQHAVLAPVAKPAKTARKPAKRGAKMSGAKPEAAAVKAKRRRRGSARRNEPTVPGAEPTNVTVQEASATA